MNQDNRNELKENQPAAASFEDSFPAKTVEYLKNKIAGCGQTLLAVAFVVDGRKMHSPVFESTKGGTHAEPKMIDWLRKNKAPLRNAVSTVTMVMYTTNSPCFKCGQKLIKCFKQYFPPRLEISILIGKIHRANWHDNSQQAISRMARISIA